MKILFIDFRIPYILKDAEYPAGGFAVELRNWLYGLTDIGCQCGLLTFRGAKELVNKDLPFELIDTYPQNKGIKVLKYFYIRLPAMMRATKQFQPDLIIQGVPEVHTGMMAFIAKRLNIPFVYRAANDVDCDERLKTEIPLYTQVAYRYGLKNAIAILSQNQYQYTHFKKQYPNISHHIFYNPFAPVSKEVSIENRSERKYIAWLGIFRPQKNLPLLLNVARSLPEYDFHIGGMPLKHIDDNIQKALDGLKQLKNVQFRGYIKQIEVGKFLSQAIMLLNTSHFEGLSNTFLEAFTSGTPLVCPARVDPNGIISQDKLGFTSNHDDQLADMVTKLFTLNGQEYALMAYRCQEYVATKHNPQVLARQLLQSLQGIVK